MNALRFLALGDSYTCGEGVAPAQRWPVQLARALRDRGIDVGEPGIIAMTALLGASMTGSNLSLEMNTGSHERLLVSPLRRSSLLVGRALKEVVPVVAQGLLIIAVVTPFSFELHVTGILVGLVVIAVFAVGIGALAIGNVKYQVQHRLLVRMRGAEKPVYLSFPEALAVAREVLAET